MTNDRRTLLMGAVLGLFVTVSAPGLAEAACTVTLTQPPNNSTQVNSVAFKWNGGVDCAQYRVQFSPSGMYTPGNYTSTPYQTTKVYQLSETDWETNQLGTWAAGVYWRVQGKDAAGAVVTSPKRRVLMDPDIDDDGFSVTAGGDCDDDDATAFPGGIEVCGDGIDQDCSGADEACEGFDVPDSVGWSFATFPVRSADGVILYYAGYFWVNYLDADFAEVCTDTFFFNADFDNTPGAYGCPSCKGELNTFVFLSIPEESTCNFEDPSLYLDETFWNSADADWLLHYQAGMVPGAGTPIGGGLTIDDQLTLIADAGLVVSHGAYSVDEFDIDGDANTTEIVPWGLFYGDAGTIRPNFTTFETVYEDGTPTMFIYYSLWWVFTL